MKHEADVRGIVSRAEEIADPIDLLKRFTPTPFELRLQLFGTTVRIETNSDVMRERLRAFLPLAQAESQSEARLFWRIVVEAGPEPCDEFPSVHGMSHGGLSFLRVGQTSFLAYDRRARQGISFISENFVRDEKTFRRYFLPALMSLLHESIEAAL